jgi:four helix bundle protein
MPEENFHDALRKLMDSYVHGVYDASAEFPQSELFGVTSQLRRAALSIPLNYTEGYARQKKKTYKYFLEIAYGSLKESVYLVEFSYKRKYLAIGDYEALTALADRIGRMLWGIISNIR